MDASPQTVGSGSRIKWILLTGVMSGLLDAVGAILTFLMQGGKNPIRIFNYIASGVFGKEALSGGSDYAILGLIFHLVIATIWTTVFFIAYPRMRLLARNWWLSGLGYGVFVWIGMNLVVLPLSNTPPTQFSARGIVIGIAVLMICIGLPISLSASRYYK